VQKLWTLNKFDFHGNQTHYGKLIFNFLLFFILFLLVSVAEGWIVTNFTNPIECSDCKTPPIKSFIWHEDGLSGFTTFLALFPEQDFVVSVLTNAGLALSTNRATL